MSNHKQSLKGICLCCFLILGIQLFSESFAFKYTKAQKYRIIGQIDQQVYIDDLLSYTAYTLNKVAVEVLETKNDRGYLSWVFRISEQLADGSRIFKIREETLNSRFWRDKSGKFSDSEIYLMPVVRDIPLFPDEDIKIGEDWTARGEEFHDFRAWGIAYPARNSMEVNYIYLRDETRGEPPNTQSIAVFKIYYISEGNFEEYQKYSAQIPLQIIGFSDQLLFWNKTKGRLEGYKDKFNVRYFFANGRVQQFKGTVKAEVFESQPMDKTKMVTELDKLIKEHQISGVQVDKNSEGVILRLENIQFPADSAVLVPAEQEKLKKIGELLKQYPDRDLLITGHTALAGTEQARQLLSENRAEAVGEFLLNRGVRKAANITYQGFGAKQPIADNTTSQGMEKNRRVEITILEN